MKTLLQKLIPIGAFMLLICLSSLAYGQEKSQFVASCSMENEARCTGSANCRACKNCSRCQYCNSGGTCGVCSGSSNAYYYSEPQRKPKAVTHKKAPSSRSTHRYNKAESYGNGNNLTYFIDAKAVNLRKGPGTKFPIIMKLGFSERLVHISGSGTWIQVKVERNGQVGYIHKNFLRR